MNRTAKPYRARPKLALAHYLLGRCLAVRTFPILASPVRCVLASLRLCVYLERTFNAKTPRRQGAKLGEIHEHITHNVV